LNILNSLFTEKLLSLGLKGLNSDARKCWYELFEIDPHFDITKYNSYSVKAKVRSSGVANNNKTKTGVL